MTLKDTDGTVHSFQCSEGECRGDDIPARMLTEELHGAIIKNTPEPTEPTHSKEDESVLMQTGSDVNSSQTPSEDTAPLSKEAGSSWMMIIFIGLGVILLVGALFMVKNKKS